MNELERCTNKSYRGSFRAEVRQIWGPPLYPSWFSCPQVALLRAQLTLERKQRQDYIARSVQTSRELADLHHSLSHSLLAVAQAPEATVLEAETRKLDQSLTQSLMSPGPVLLHHNSSPMTPECTPR